MKYPQINELIEFCKRNRVNVIQLPDNYLADNTSFPLINLTILDKDFIFFVDDEYDDLKVGSLPLSVCIALRALESYDYAEDYLIWCTQHGFEAANMQVREHFRNLGEIVSWFNNNSLKVFSFISDYDFELNAGAAQYLRENPNLTV